MLRRYILGIDAAWSTKNPSGVALLESNPNQQPKLIKVGRSYEEFQNGLVNLDLKVTGSFPSFSELLEPIPRPIIIALDIPMAPFLIEGRREVDQALSREYGRYKAAVHSPTKDRPGIIATAIFEQLKNLGYQWAIDYKHENVFFEVYPHASIIELFGYSERLTYKVNKKAKYWPNATKAERKQNIISKLNELRDHLASLIDISEKLIPRLDRTVQYKDKFLKGYEDLLDATVCAVTGYYYLQGKIKPFGDKDGVAWVPDIIANDI
ncbi:MAG: DUF429 domain-containing protein [Bacillota bacterium]|nr:DUF429 domain-containing protein [Bacillota bacterium]